MKELRIPLALDESNLVVAPDNARKDEKYFCPSCGDLLVLRKGEIKKPHFAHKATDTCSEETVIHKLAKFLIIQKVDEWKKGNSSSPVINRKCPACKSIIKQELPDKVDTAIAERKLESGYIADVVIITNDKIAAAIEVKVHHAIDEKKKNNIGIPFIEVLGEEVVKNPLEWKPITDKFKPFRCKECEKAVEKYNQKIKSVSQKTKVEIPTTFYRTAYSNCWRCGEELLIFVWPNDSIYSHKLPENIQRPKTIQYRYSKMAGTKYWANTCPYCNSIQGDFFLFSEPDSPLFGFHCGSNNENEFVKDMKKLAIRYFHGC